MERSKFSLSFFSLQQLHVSFNSSMQILGIYSWSRNMVWRSLNQVLSLIMDLHGRWRRGEETERFTSRLALCVCVLLDLGGLIWLEFFLLTFFIKSCCLLWWTGIQRRNQAGVVTHICLHVLRTLSHSLSHSLSLSLWHTHTHSLPMCMCVIFKYAMFFQLCGNHGTCILSWGLALCVAYDSGILCSKIVILGYL
jgi:hypothetical protein